MADSDDDDFYEEAEAAGDRLEEGGQSEKRDCVNQQDPQEEEKIARPKLLQQRTYLSSEPSGLLAEARDFDRGNAHIFQM